MSILNNVSSGEVSACTVEVILKVRLQTARNSQFKATEPSVWEEQPVRGGSMNYWGGGSTKAQYETNKDYIELSYKAAVAFRE